MGPLPRRFQLPVPVLNLRCLLRLKSKPFSCRQTKAERFLGRSHSAPSLQPLQRAQEVQQILLLLIVQLLKKIDHAVRLRTGTAMLLNRREQTTMGECGAAVVKKENALA